MFELTDGSRYNLTVNDVKSDLTDLAVKEVMNLVIAKNILNPRGQALKKIHDAKIVETIEQDLAVEAP